MTFKIYILGAQSGTESASEGAIISNVIAGAYNPGHEKGKPLKPTAVSNSASYSNDFILPARDTDSDYDSSEVTGSNDSSHSNLKSSTSTTSGSINLVKSTSSPSKYVNNHVTSESGPDLSGSITENIHLKSPIDSNKKYAFPGPSGSIFDYKPAPPGGGGPDKAWVVSPVTESHNGVQASSGATINAGTAGLTFKLVSSFPGATGSIFDSKPATGAPENIHTSKPGVASTPVLGACTGNSCAPSGSYNSYNSFPGSSGSIYDSKPVSGIVVSSQPSYSSGTSCLGLSCSSSGTFKPSISLPGASGSIHDSKPVTGTVTSPSLSNGSGVGCLGSSCTSVVDVVSSSQGPGVGCSGTRCSFSAVNEPYHYPATGCSSSSGCAVQPPLASSTGSGGVTSVIGILPGPLGSIHDSKPVIGGSVGCGTTSCAGQSSSSILKPTIQGIAPSHSGFSKPIPPGSSGNVHDNESSSGASSSAVAGSNAQTITGVEEGIYQPSSLGSRPQFPGSTGSIYDSKPANSVSSSVNNVGTGVQSVISNTQLQHQSVSPISLPGSLGSIHQSKPATLSPNNVPINADLPYIIETLPGHPGSIHNSKLVGTGVAHSNKNTGAASTVPCTGSSCTYSSNKPLYSSFGCSGSACGNRPSTGYISVPVIPVGIISEPYHKTPSFGDSGCTGSSCATRPFGSSCSGSSCGGYNLVKPVLKTMLVPPIAIAPPVYNTGCTGVSCSNIPSLDTFSTGCIGKSCSGVIAPPIDSDCSGSPCSTKFVTSGQASLDGSITESKTHNSAETESGKHFYH